MSDDGIREFLAGPETERLGLGFSALPPNPIVIKRVHADTWADEEGIQVGDVLVALNGVDVSGMSQDEFKAAMQVRPLSVRIAELWLEEEVETYKAEEQQKLARRATACDPDMELASRTECRVERTTDSGQSERTCEQPVFAGPSSETPPLLGTRPPREAPTHPEVSRVEPVNENTADVGQCSPVGSPRSLKQQSQERQADRQRMMMCLSFCCGQS